MVELQLFKNFVKVSQNFNIFFLGFWSLIAALKIDHMFHIIFKIWLIQNEQLTTNMTGPPINYLNVLLQNRPQKQLWHFF